MSADRIAAPAQTASATADPGRRPHVPPSALAFAAFSFFAFSLFALAVAPLVTTEQWNVSARSAAGALQHGAPLVASQPRWRTLQEFATVAYEQREDRVHRIADGERRRASAHVDSDIMASTVLGVLACVALVALAWFGRRERMLTRALRSAMERETRLRAEEEELRALAEQHYEDLVRISDSKNRLMRGFTHDVKNPLGAADGYMQLLEEGIYGPLAPTQERSVARVRASIRAALDLIDDLLEVARAATGDIHVASVPLDLAALAREAAEDYRAQAEAKGLAMRISVAPDLPAIESDPIRVRQVLGNMISNAVKYTASGSVTIEAWPRSAGRRADDAPGAVVEVSDTGLGIPVEKRRLLFREFMRLDPNAGPGVGIGLAMSFKIVQALCGALSMRDGPAGGSTFVLWLPVDAGSRGPSGDTRA